MDTETGTTDRDELDRYYTPPECAAAIVKWLDDQYGLAGKRCLEPHVGLGGFADALLQYEIHSLRVIDADPEAPFLVRMGTDEIIHHKTPIAGNVGRFEELCKYIDPVMDIIPGNPPFNCMEEQCRAALPLLSPTGVLAWILPQAFTASKERQPFFREFCPTWELNLVPRISQFLGPTAKPEMRDMSVFVWEAENQGRGLNYIKKTWLHWEPIRKPRKPRKQKETSENDRQETAPGSADHQETVQVQVQEDIEREPEAAGDCEGADHREPDSCDQTREESQVFANEG